MSRSAADKPQVAAVATVAPHPCPPSSATRERGGHDAGNPETHPQVMAQPAWRPVKGQKIPRHRNTSHRTPALLCGRGSTPAPTSSPLSPHHGHELGAEPAHFLSPTPRLLPRTPAAAPLAVPAHAHLVGHLLAVLLRGVDQCLVQVHHKHQLPVSVQALLVFPPQLFSLLQPGREREMTEEGRVEAR